MHHIHLESSKELELDSFHLLSLFSGLSAQPFRSQQMSCIGDPFKNQRNLLFYSCIALCSPCSQNDTNYSLNYKGNRSLPSTELLQELPDPISTYAERGILQDAVKWFHYPRRSIGQKLHRTNIFVLHRSDSLNTKTDN